MFAGYHDDVDSPSEDDVGKFVTQKELNTWWKALQKKYPNVYPPNEPCPTQHAPGTKMMCFIDDDPNKPIRVTIVGSQWRKDSLMGKQAMYVYEDSAFGGGSYDTTEFSAAHEEDPDVGWTLGWDAPPPTADE